MDEMIPEPSLIGPRRPYCGSRSKYGRGVTPAKVRAQQNAEPALNIKCADLLVNFNKYSSYLSLIVCYSNLRRRIILLQLFRSLGAWRLGRGAQMLKPLSNFQYFGLPPQ